MKRKEAEEKFLEALNLINAMIKVASPEDDAFKAYRLLRLYWEDYHCRGVKPRLEELETEFDWTVQSRFNHDGPYAAVLFDMQYMRGAYPGYTDEEYERILNYIIDAVDVEDGMGIGTGSIQGAIQDLTETGEIRRLK